MTRDDTPVAPSIVPDTCVSKGPLKRVSPERPCHIQEHIDYGCRAISKDALAARFHPSQSETAGSMCFEVVLLAKYHPAQACEHEIVVEKIIERLNIV